VIGAARWLPLSLAVHAAFGAAVWRAGDRGERALFIDMRLIDSDAPDPSESLRAGNRERPAGSQPRRSPERPARASSRARDMRAASRETGTAAVGEVATPPATAAPPVTSAPSRVAAPPVNVAPPVGAVPQTAAASPPSAPSAPRAPSAPPAAAPPPAVARADPEPSAPTAAVAPAPPLAAATTPSDTSATLRQDAGATVAPDAHARAGPPGATSSPGLDAGASHGGRSSSGNDARGGNGATGGGGSTPGGSAPGDGPLALAVPGDAGLGGYGPYLSALRRRLHEALEYPATARRRGLTGTVELEIALEVTGRVNDVRLVRSSSHAVLDAAALEAARSLGRVPFPPDIRPRPLRVLMPVVFELR
jgi:protein TonB